MEVSSLHSIGGAGVRTCVHCYRHGDNPHDEWCPERGKKNDPKAGASGGGGGGPGDPNTPPSPIEPEPTGVIVDAEFSEVPKELPAPQRAIEHHSAVPSPSLDTSNKEAQPLLEHRDNAKKRLPRPHRE